MKLVYLCMITLGGFQLFDAVCSQPLINSSLHGFQATHVDMCLWIIDKHPKLMFVRRQQILDIHFLLVRLLPRDGVVTVEVVWKICSIFLEFVIVEEGLGVRYT